MSLLTCDQQRILAEAIAADSGIGLDYLAFLEVALAAFEDIPGGVVQLPSLDLLNQLWRIYSTLVR